jgi:glyoxylase-like metal-dependent hydrolase (beta-lactamase superfamily II)
MRTSSILAALAISLGAGAAYAQQEDYSKVTIKTTKVAEGVYMLEGAGGNIGLSVGEDGVVVIDDQFAPLTPKIQAAITAITPKPIKFVLNTHWHGDHTGGNENLGKAGVLIVDHDLRLIMRVAERILAAKLTQRLGQQIVVENRVGGSTKEIRTLIQDVRAAANTTVMVTEDGGLTYTPQLWIVNGRVAKPLVRRK